MAKLALQDPVPLILERALDVHDRAAAGRLEDAEPFYGQVLDREADHPWAYPSACALRHALGRPGAWGAQLAAYAAANADNARAAEMVAWLKKRGGAK